jgi:hydrogenase nickel incorporation protein HypB
VIFRKADLVLLTKTDLLPAIEEFSTERARAAIGRVHGPGPVLEVSAKKGAGLDAWTQWIVDRLGERRQTMGHS